jgi:hypothetical protein
MTQPALPPMISVLRDSHGCVGFLRSAGPRGFQAYDAVGQLLGLFQDKQEAIEAITAQIRQETTNGNERATKAA